MRALVFEGQHRHEPEAATLNVVDADSPVACRGCFGKVARREHAAAQEKDMAHKHKEGVGIESNRRLPRDG